MLKVVLATGHDNFDKKFRKMFEGRVEVVAVPPFREAVAMSAEEHNPDVIVLTNVLPGTTSMEDIIIGLRAKYPDSRIIFVPKDITPDFKMLLYRFAVYDILDKSFEPEVMEKALFEPKRWADVAEEVIGLENIRMNMNSDEADITGMEQIHRNEYARIRPMISDVSSLYQELVIFWSAQDQSGNTFSASNTALFLASNPDLKVLLLDCNTRNPGIHLQFGFTDIDHNLGAFMEDLADGDASPGDFLEEYTISHPVYENLKIVPGNILRGPPMSDEAYIEAIDSILEEAQVNNYTTVLMDVEAGIPSKFQVHLLRRATKILLHTTESPSNLLTVRKLFDPELGPFVPSMIPKKKVFPIINKGTTKNLGRYRADLEAILDGNPVCATIKSSDDIHESIFDGTPLFSQPNEYYYKTFYKIANTIHPNVFKPLEDPKAPGMKKTLKKRTKKKKK